MPELPDLELYLHALRPRLVGQSIERVRIASPFLIRTVEPPIEAAIGRAILDLSRLGKRIVWRFEGDLFFVFHLMIAGRFQWKEKGITIPGRLGLAAFDVPSATLLLTEAGAKKRASLHVVSGADAVASLDPGGVEVLGLDFASFDTRLRSENHTLKRALTDPTLFSGIGNAYSDEILHAARLSPARRTRDLDAGETARLHAAVRHTLESWTRR
ncbi:MAG TPA: DNA-formamidopyrimidine glycosylase family protein, partial [Candidatus Binatia bacterium]|nr:DNA-formamidopyrimidine glycosylase family protein [Candidatus Binatia bacterium]